MKENEFMDIFQMRCSEFDVATLPDYRKGAYGVVQYFGVDLKPVNTRQKFAMVVYQHKRSINTVMVEMFKYSLPDAAKNPILVPISAETLKKFTAKTQFHDFVVDFKGHGFIKGMKSENFTTLRPSYDLCLWTNAIDFLRLYGHAFATALMYADVVHDIDEGEEFNANIANIKNFVNEMNETGIYACGIRNATERIKDIQGDMVEEDKSTRENYETWRSAVDTLAQYGIEYKREKDEAVWP